MVSKYEIRSSKSETNRKYSNPNYQNLTESSLSRTCPFLSFEFVSKFGFGISGLSERRLLPFDAKLLKPPAIFQRRRIRAAQMQLLGKIERQLLGPLRFDDAFILLEDTAVPRV